jgi:AraC-like DNA-binding protein
MRRGTPARGTPARARVEQAKGRRLADPLKGKLTVRAEILREFDALVTMLGGDSGELLRDAGLEPVVCAQAGAFIPYARVIDVFERAAARLDCPDFGLRLAAAQAEQGATKVFGPLDVAMRNSPTVGEALRYCSQHLHAFTSGARMYVEKLPDDPRWFMLFEVLLTPFSPQRQVVEHALALTQLAVQAISGGQARAREAWFTHEPVAPVATYRSMFNAPVKFGQSLNGLFFEEQDFATCLPDPDPQLHEIATSFIDDRFPKAVVSLSTRVRILIARLLVDGQCTHENVAATLGLHPRTLQRRLREEGESFESIKDSVRRDVALRYLQQPDVPLVRVTEILGYSETSVLSRSCHRWFCASPRELRNELSGGSR